MVVPLPAQKAEPLILFKFGELCESKEPQNAAWVVSRSRGSKTGTLGDQLDQMGFNGMVGSDCYNIINTMNEGAQKKFLDEIRRPLEQQGYHIQRTLGKGAFGEVFMASSGTHSIYARKP